MAEHDPVRWIRSVLHSPASYSQLNPLELKPSEAPKSISVRPTNLQGQLLTGPTFRNLRVTTARRGNARGPARVGIALFLDPVESELGLQVACADSELAARPIGSSLHGFRSPPRSDADALPSTPNAPRPPNSCPDFLDYSKSYFGRT